ncbi:MAG: hypothetical protein H6809_07975 [Phycisphaeraceae bacterium]|nr:hypothetical protein [Phycisphaeraceae bacterium]
MDKHDWYELCVQSPGHLVPLVRAIHGGAARVLGEDFCGTAALSIEWARAGGEAIAVDLDVGALAKHPDAPGVRKVRADVREVADAADVVSAGPPIGYLHTRRALVGICDTCARLAVGGVHLRRHLRRRESAFATGTVHRPHHPGSR